MGMENGEWKRKKGEDGGLGDRPAGWGRIMR